MIKSVLSAIWDTILIIGGVILVGAALQVVFFAIAAIFQGLFLFILLGIIVFALIMRLIGAQPMTTIQDKLMALGKKYEKK